MFIERRGQLEEKLLSVFGVIYTNEEIFENIKKNMFEKHAILPGTANMVLLGTTELSSLTVEELFWYTKTTIEVLKDVEYKDAVADIGLDKYFTNSEIVQFSSSKRESEKVEVYPLRIKNVTRVNDDQWIATFDTNFTKHLHDNQLINYNRNTQRNLTVKKAYGHLSYSITLIEKSVKEIEQGLEKGLFIPNTLTLNLNVDNPEVKFDYNEEKREIILYAGQFDILDGFHRYRALMRVKNKNPDFNTNFTFRIVNFNEDKANTFIAQEDKTNKIKQNYVRTLDSTRHSNRVVKMLNEDSGSYTYGQIGRLGTENIDFGILSDLIEYNFKVDDKSVVKVSIYVKDSFNQLIEKHPMLLENRLTFKELSLIVRVFYYCLQKEKNASALTLKCLERIDELDDKKFVAKRVRKVVFNDIDRLIKKVDDNV